MSNNTIISTGNTYRIYDSAVQTHAELPVGTYKVRFNPMSGYTLEKVGDLDKGAEKVYGNHDERLRRVFATYGRFDRSLGVLMSGDKGMGKSLLVRMISAEAIDRGLPVVVVDAAAPGIADFLDSLGEVVVVFDEFEKVFPAGHDEDNAQSQFLSLFDGVSTQRRLYILTVNEIHHLSTYLINRPGRFHYHLRFDYPDTDRTREYLHDQAPNAIGAEIEKAVVFSRKVNLNYDHLRAIAFELNNGEKFASMIGELNIKRVSAPYYRVDVQFSCGTTLTTTQSLELFAPDDGDSSMEAVGIYSRNGGVELRFDVNKTSASNDTLVVPADAITVDSKNEELGDVVAMHLTLVGQRSIGF